MRSDVERLARTQRRRPQNLHLAVAGYDAGRRPQKSTMRFTRRARKNGVRVSAMIVLGGRPGDTDVVTLISTSFPVGVASL